MGQATIRSAHSLLLPPVLSGTIASMLVEATPRIVMVFRFTPIPTVLAYGKRIRMDGTQEHSVQEDKDPAMDLFLNQTA